MKLNIKSQTKSDAWKAVFEMLGITCTADGIEVNAVCGDKGEMSVSKKNGTIEIKYGALPQFARALSYVKQNEGKESYQICETAKFNSNGVFLELSQNHASMKPEYIKKYLNYMVIMGLDTIYLNLEDNFEVPGEPYFGYMRGRYTMEELRDIDNYAAELGVCVIPCVQTLSHLREVLKWPTYAAIREDDATLLVGEERVYELITNILKTMRDTFRSKKIHIGMDEAFTLGRGVYMSKHGPHSMISIMKEHMARVLPICEQLGIEPMVWSDMLINSAHGQGTGMANYYNTEAPFLPEAKDAFPRDLIQVLWDYNHHNKETYKKILERHYILTDRVVFAGATWNWNSFTTDYDKTFLITKPALEACKEMGVTDVFMTTWGDCGVEGSMFETILGAQLYAELGYRDDVSDESIKVRFKACTRCEYDDFRSMTYIDNKFDHVPPEGYVYQNHSRWLVWQDILCGKCDAHLVPGEMEAQYKKVHETMRAAIERNPSERSMFAFLAQVAAVLEIKAEIGLKLKAAYDSGNKDELKLHAEKTLPELKSRFEKLWEIHRELWFETNKAFGWEVQELRYGAMILRVDTAIKRVLDYINGDVDRLDELDEPRLTYTGADGFPFEVRFDKIYTGSSLF